MHAWHGKRLSRSALADAHLGLLADHVAEELKELVCIVDVLSQGHRLGFRFSSAIEALSRVFLIIGGVLLEVFNDFPPCNIGKHTCLALNRSVM